MNDVGAIVALLLAVAIWMLIGCLFAKKAPITWRRVFWYGLLGGPILFVLAALFCISSKE